METHSSRLQRELRQTRAFRSPEQESAIAILRTADALRRFLSAVIEPYGVTLQQYNVLRILRGSHPSPLPTLEIGERLIERTPGITRLIDRLEEKGLVGRERRRDDRRQVHCRITPEGLVLLDRLDAPVDEADAAALGGLEPQQIDTLLDLLERVRSRV
jgi:MarR family transcriptional regulator, organic hydroperoxide resistance regulator